MSRHVDVLSSGEMSYAPQPAGLYSQLQQSHLAGGLQCLACTSACLTAVLQVQDGRDQAAARPKLAQPAHAVQRWNTPSPDEEDAADLLLARQQAPFADMEHAFTVRASSCLDVKTCQHVISLHSLVLHVRALPSSARC